MSTLHAACMQAALFLWKHSPQSYAALFQADRNGCIQQWFNHFGPAGNTNFRFGAKALAAYAISHREEVNFTANPKDVSIVLRP